MRHTIAALFLLASTAAAPVAAQDIILKGTVVTPTTVLNAAAVTIKGNRIASVTAVGANAPGIATDDVIFPGLIDLHNHLTWNVLPDWQPGRKFTNRSQWRTAADYLKATGTPYDKMRDKGAGCDMNRFGEVKALVNGATATVGSLAPAPDNPKQNACIDGLVRNVDYAADLTSPPVMNHEPYRNFVDPLDLNAADAALVRGTDPASTVPGTLHAAVLHVAEGTDAAAHDEFRLIKERQFLRRGVSIIHGIALTLPDFADMARAGVGLVWSPHGHFILYGKTTDIVGALNAGVLTAIGPDWSPTASHGMLEELNFAYRYNTTSLNHKISDSALVAMATINPAKLAGLDGQLGSIEAGKLADLLIVKRRGATAYEALLTAGPGDIQLVMIGGVPVYGDRALMTQLLPKATLEYLSICGQPKALHIAPGNAAWDSWQRTHERLTAVMKGLGIAPSALVSCMPAR